MLFIGINLLNLNYAVGSFLNLSGQDVSAITNSACFLIILINLNKVLKTPLIAISTLLVFVIPLIGYFVNYYGQDLSSLLYWAKRSGSFVITLGACAILVERLSGRALVNLSLLFFILNCVCVLYSYLFPQEALLLFTAGNEEQWGDLTTISVSGASGSGINVNDTGFYLITTYLSYHIFITSSNIYPTNWRSALIDSLLLTCVLLGGSRGTFIIAILCIPLISFYQATQGAFKKNNYQNYFKTKFKYLAYISCFVFALSFFISFSDSSGMERITNFLSGQEDNFSIKSTDYRRNAMMVGLNTFIENPFIGVGFDSPELKNIILPHNMFIYYAETNGFIAFVLYIFFIYTILKLIKKAGFLWISTAFAIVIVGFSLLMHSVFDAKTFPWLIISAAYLIQKRQRSFYKINQRFAIT
jgi:hypothetical protein